MKKLSIEKKAKAYDEIIEKANKMHHENCEACQMCIEELIPELAESEDERIRKELIENLKELSKMYDTLQTEKEYSKVQSWIAWLEKQGKKAKYHDICDKCVRQPTCQSDCFLQQSEQKPIDKVEPKFKIGQIIKKEGFNTGFTIASIINGFYYNDEGDYFPFTDQDNWELVLQKHAERSEEDKRKIDRIYTILRQAADTHAFSTSCRLIGDKECIELQDFLKSIQSQWKPSDEQMYSLNWVANVLLKQDGIVEKETSKILDSLYNELKKLKE